MLHHSAQLVGASDKPPLSTPPTHPPARLQIPGANGAGPSVAASRPATLKEVPSCKMGKLLVFESGKVKLQVRGES